MFITYFMHALGIMSLTRRYRWLLLLLWPAWLEAANGRLKIQFFDVGQADATLITCPHGTHRMLIDSGDKTYPESQQNFQRELKAALGTATKIDVAVASHPHTDHIGGMLWVLNSYRVGTYIDNGKPSETKTWSNLETARRKQIKKGTLAYIDGTASSLTKLRLCDDVSFTLITPAAHAKLTHTNDGSVGVRLDYRGKSFLFIGDMEEHAEVAWLDKLSPEARTLADVDVLKVGHHGSDTSSTAGFIQAVSPDLAFVMCGVKGVGTNARYKHPRASTMRTLADWFKNHAPAVTAGTDQIWAYSKSTEKWIAMPRPSGLWLTVADGTITLETDGIDFFVTDSK